MPIWRVRRQRVENVGPGLSRRMRRTRRLSERRLRHCADRLPGRGRSRLRGWLPRRDRRFLPRIQPLAVQWIARRPGERRPAAAIPPTPVGPRSPVDRLIRQDARRRLRSRPADAARAPGWQAPPSPRGRHRATSCRPRRLSSGATTGLFCFPCVWPSLFIYYGHLFATVASFLLWHRAERARGFRLHFLSLTCLCNSPTPAPPPRRIVLTTQEECPSG